MKIIRLSHNYSEGAQLKYRFLWQIEGNKELSNILSNIKSKEVFDETSFALWSEETNGIYGLVLKKKQDISEPEYWNELADEQKNSIDRTNRMLSLKYIGLCNNSSIIRDYIKLILFDRFRIKDYNWLVRFEAENGEQALRLSSLYEDLVWFKQTLLMYTEVRKPQDLNFLLEFK